MRFLVCKGEGWQAVGKNGHFEGLVSAKSKESAVIPDPPKYHSREHRKYKGVLQTEYSLLVDKIRENIRSKLNKKRKILNMRLLGKPIIQCKKQVYEK